MRKAISLLIVSAAFLSLALCGCNPAVEDEASTDDNDSISYAIENSSPVTTGNLITKAKVSESGDINVEYYDNSDNLVEVFVWNEKTRKSHIVMTYSDTNKIITKEELSPTENNKILTSYRYDSDDELIQSSISEYENGFLMKTTTNDKDGNTIGYNVSIRDDSGRVTKIERYNADDTIREYSVYDFDENGMTTKASTYENDGTLKKYIVYSFDENNRMCKDEYYDSEDNLIEYFLYEYYDNGNRKTVDHYDADGNLISSDSFEDTTK